MTEEQQPPPAGEYLVEKGQMLPEWAKSCIDWPWPFHHDMIIHVCEDGSMTITRSRGAAEHR